ncbi:MAG: hypothetical protein WC261_10625 [Synergistaceae bacterium]|jgi:Holliday junction resolvase|nr:hypothetical protein [Candidatus Omnitrophota bacterium]
MGKSQRDKGYRGENNLVNMLKESGIDAKRVPLSGATDFQKGDIVANGMTGEVKIRGSGFKQIYDWLAAHDFLAIKADRQQYLVVLPIEKFIELLKG